MRYIFFTLMVGLASLAWSDDELDRTFEPMDEGTIQCEATAGVSRNGKMIISKKIASRGRLGLENVEAEIGDACRLCQEQLEEEEITLRRKETFFFSSQCSFERCTIGSGKLPVKIDLAKSENLEVLRNQIVCKKMK